MTKLATSVGADIRSIRNNRGFSLAAVASRLGRSVGWLSQIERGISQPSREDLDAISRELDVPLSLFFDNDPGDEREQGYVVRGENRRDMTAVPGLREQLLSPDLTDSFEVIYAVHQAGAALKEPKVRATQELVYLISGQLDVTIAGHRFSISAGDSFRIRGEAFQWSNPHDQDAHAIWVISPPIY